MSDPRTDDWTADASRGWQMESPEERRARVFDEALAGTYREPTAAPDAVTDPGRRVRTPGPLRLVRRGA